MVIKKTVIFVFGVFVCTSLLSQNRQILYGFTETPQTLMLNPGAETNYNYHVGIPVLSGFSMNLGITGTKISDLFLNDGIDFNTKLENVINQLTERDFLSANLQLDVLNGGFRLNDKTYISFGFYEEIDFMMYFPKDILTLLHEGNAAYLNKRFDISQLKMRGELFGVLHVGFSKKINSKLNFGSRLKLYSGSINISTVDNGGSFTTTEGGENIYRYYLNNIDVGIYTSGIYENNSVNIGSNGYFFGGNLGLGVDVGFTYHHTPQLEFSGSLLDVGFINYSKNVRNTKISGSYIFDGIELRYDSTAPVDYWAELDSDFKDKVPREENTNAYISWRPIKLNAAVKYSFGKEKRSKECYTETFKQYYDNSIGVQLYAITRPLSNQFALTTFYEKSIGRNFHTKVTYTVDDYSFSNIGVGVSSQIGIFNAYGIVGNVLKLSDIATTNNVSLQFGLNLIFN